MKKLAKAIVAFSAVTASAGGNATNKASLAPVFGAAITSSQSVGITEAQMLECIDALRPVTEQSIFNNGYEGWTPLTYCRASSEVIGLNVLFAVNDEHASDTAVYQMVTVTPQAVEISDYKHCALNDDDDVCLDKYTTDIPAYKVAFTPVKMLDETRPEPTQLFMEDLPLNIRSSMDGALAARKKLNAQLWQFKR